MRKIFTLILSLITLLANAQLKSIKLESKTSGNTTEIRLDVPLIHQSATEIKALPLNLKSINTQKKAAWKAGFRILATDENGRPIAIEGSNIATRGNRNLPLDEKVQLYIKEISPFAQFTRDDDEFVIISTDTENEKFSHIRMKQQWNNVPVYGAELMLHSEDQEINFVNGRTKSKPEILPSTMALQSDDAVQQVANNLGVVQDLTAFKNSVLNVDQSTSELVYYQHKNQWYLCYHITYYQNLIDRWEYFVDASNGHIIHKFMSICKFHHAIGQACHHTHSDHLETNSSVSSNASINMMDGPATAKAIDLFNVSRDINTYLVGNTYYLIDGARSMFKSTSAMPDDPEGTIWTIDAFNTSPQKQNFNYDHVKSGNNSWSGKTSISAHYNGGKAYDYFKNIHSRNSINGSGGNIVSIINVADEDGASMGNAFWNGQAMFYGNGDSNFSPLARGLDVAGHEMTHGVVQNSANLEYEGESGALNESFADVFGSLIDREDWQIGEDVVKTSAFPSGALRSLSDPHNGAAQGDFNKGWQPRIYSERYTGNEDNGGVHINSGIPNYAYFLFASDPAVGKDKAEKVYYRALNSYLTKSSQFVDARIAVVRAAKELYGDAIANIATSAFDKVQIPGGSGGNYDENVNTNPGTDLVIFTSNENDNLFLFTADGQALADPLSENDPLSKPSVTDDGALVMYVATDKKIHYIQIDWAKGTFVENILNTGQSTWRNVAVSKDGSKISALPSAQGNTMWIFDLASGKGKEFTLYNPTYTQGVTTGDVLYADAMEWDFTGEQVMYDAENAIKSNTSGTINYWDIGFIKVWNNKANDFQLDGKISKLFTSLEEGESVGNPTFSKNSPDIIAFDYLNGNEFSILGVNTERSDLGLIADRSDNEEAGYPSYSRNDQFLLYDSDDFFTTNINIVKLNANKVEAKASDISVFGEDLRWGVWFSNGKRVLSALNEINDHSPSLSIWPNPANNELNVSLENLLNDDMTIIIEDLTGRVMKSVNDQSQQNKGIAKVDISDMTKGIYIVKVINKKSSSLLATKFIKL